MLHSVVSSAILRVAAIWVWFNIKPPGTGPLILVHVSIYRSGKPFYPAFDPQPYVSLPELRFALVTFWACAILVVNKKPGLLLTTTAIST